MGSNWITVASIPPIPEFDGEDIASFIIRSVNAYGKLQPHLRKIAAVIERWQQGSSLSPQEKRQAREMLEILDQQNDLAFD